jgi:hypothetical protein
MTFRLTTDILRFGKAAPYMEDLGARRGGPEGIWLSQSATLNQVYSLQDLGGADVAATQRESTTYGDWADAILARNVRLLAPIKPYAPSAAPFVDWREYAIAPGKLETFTKLMLRVLPVREKFGPCVGVWTPASGEPEKVVHVWAFDNYAHRESVRAAVAKEPAWQEYLEAITPLLTRMSSTFLKPVGA